MSEPEVVHDQYEDLRRSVYRLSIALANPHDASEVWLQSHDTELFAIEKIAGQVRKQRIRQGKSYAIES